MPKPLRIAIVGSGYFSAFHMDAWKRIEEAQIVAVAETDEARRQAVASDHPDVDLYDDAEMMLDTVQPDIVDIITPPSSHVALIELAARRGIDVMCQKPFCGDLAGAERAAELGDRYGIKVTVHENFRFQPWYQVLKGELAQNGPSRLYRATFHLRPGDGQGAEAYLDRQPYFRAMSRFLVHETLVHLIDVARFLFGEPSTVMADIQRYNEAIAGEDSAIIILGYSDGMQVVIDGNRNADQVAENPRRTMANLLIEGAEGELSMNGDGQIVRRKHGANTLQPIDYDWRDHGFGGDCVFTTIRALVDHYVGGAPRINSARDYLTNQKIEEAVYASARSGRRIDLDI